MEAARRRWATTASDAKAVLRAREAFIAFDCLAFVHQGRWAELDERVEWANTLPPDLWREADNEARRVAEYQVLRERFGHERAVEMMMPAPE
jgi:hypothetical protein